MVIEAAPAAGNVPAHASRMPRKPLIRCSEYPYHITNRSNNREFFYVEPHVLWNIFLNCFEELNSQYSCEIHSFVMMSNHYHLLLSTPESNVGEAMKYLHREVAREANRRAGRVNHFFGGRYKWTLVSNELYYWNAVKYIFRNPVRAGICTTVTDYAFSSLNSKSEGFEWKMRDLFQDRTETIELDRDWLNEPFLKEIEIAIQLALRRREFKLPRDRNCYLPTLGAARHKKGTVT